MRIVWIRHGQPAWFGPDGGKTNPELTVLGHAQAAAAAKRVQGWNVDEVWVSPALRAQETAMPICEALQIAPITHDWMTEVKIPLLAGKSPEELAPIFAEARARKVDTWWQGLPGCEAYDKFRDRICGGLDGALGRSGGRHVDHGSARLWHDLSDERCILAVCHAGTSAVAVSHLVGLGQVPWSWMRMRLNHAAFSDVQAFRVSDAQAFAMRSFNDCEHLVGDLRTR